MKKIFITYLIPVLLTIFIIFSLAFNSKVNNFLFQKTSTDTTGTKEFAFIENFRDNPQCEPLFLKDDSSATIFLLGSSELTGATEASPFNFISSHFSTKLKAVGHAGNQCFSIYSQLLANEGRLKDAPIMIILSPMWFMGKEAEGTSSKIFLEFNSERFLKRIISNDSIAEFKTYEAEIISSMFSDFGSPGFALKQLYFEHQASKSPFHYMMYYPVITIDKLLLTIKLKISGIKDLPPLEARKKIQQDKIIINWDSLYSFSKKQFLDNSTNNNWGIGNDYYSQYVKGKTGDISLCPDTENRELKDFCMLLKLLNVKKANASFLILPMNPYFYVNLHEATPLVNTIESEIKKAGFPSLNYWSDDSTKYEKGVLKDIMHLSSYGWYKADKFIIDTYHLAK
jgi:poly-D-alanine transfer protein DltD